MADTMGTIHARLPAYLEIPHRMKILRNDVKRQYEVYIDQQRCLCVDKHEVRRGIYL